MSNADATVDPEVCRVVGTDADTVALLRVGDADGQRVNTGDVVTVDRERLDGFTRAGNPAGNRSVADTVAGALQT